MSGRGKQGGNARAKAKTRSRPRAGLQFSRRSCSPSCSGRATMPSGSGAELTVYLAAVLEYLTAEIPWSWSATPPETTRRPASSPDTSSWLSATTRSSTSCWAASPSPREEESCPTSRPCCCPRRPSATRPPRASNPPTRIPSIRQHNGSSQSPHFSIQRAAIRLLWTPIPHSSLSPASMSYVLSGYIVPDFSGSLLISNQSVHICFL
ncbi:unnamed protein product [Staurois parvus]|uniref:Histone H2A n=1 Tax=Staurois parvus TaxID=386267 RepID=A0ABN9BJR7_9NEOB|nr:unnamed protein product [Staurois parvus]